MHTYAHSHTYAYKHTYPISIDVFKINCIHLKKIKEWVFIMWIIYNSVGKDPVENVSCEQQFKMMD